MRSTLSSRKCAKLGAPLTWLGSPARTPSTSTSVWLALAPRRNTLVVLPGPPDGEPPEVPFGDLMVVDAGSIAGGRLPEPLRGISPRFACVGNTYAGTKLP